MCLCPAVFSFADDAHASVRCCRSGLVTVNSSSGGMGGKRRAQPSGGAQGKLPSAKRHTPASAAEVHTTASEESRSVLAPVTITFSMRCDPSALCERQEALEAALRRVVAEFGGREFRLGRTRVGPSDDTLQRVIPFVVEHVGAAAVLRCSQACKPWQLELEARGFCYKTLQLCLTLAQGEGFHHLQRNVLQRLNASSGPAERAVWSDANAFLQRSWGWEGSGHQWLQAASQEPAASFLSRGAASTAQILGLPLVQWVGKPEGRYPGVCTLMDHGGDVNSVSFSPDGTRIVSGSDGDGSQAVLDGSRDFGKFVSSRPLYFLHKAFSRPEQPNASLGYVTPTVPILRLTSAPPASARPQSGGCQARPLPLPPCMRQARTRARGGPPVQGSPN